ncbi:MAG TPA: thioredoxin-disulfide reductase [Caldilineae bacterium]|nr:thioredoxin-disulfide reductase [Caldilineae bacterium]
MSDQVENVIIIGSGPAGLTAGLYTARAELNPLLLTGNEIGGQVALTNEIENYPGFPEGIAGPELVNRMQQQAERFGCRIEYDYVTKVDFKQHPFRIETANGKTYLAKAVIVATGATPRKLNVPGEKEFTGRGVSYCATCDGFFFRGKELVVVGGGDSALEEGLFLTRFATKVRIVHRRDQLRASQILQRRAFANDKIEFIWNSVVTSINGDDAVRSVTLKNVKTGEESELKTDGVFIYVGYVPNSELFVGQLELDEMGYIVTDKRMHTSVPGVFAAGEIQDRFFRQVATSVGQGCAAAMEVEKFIAELEDRGYEEYKEQVVASSQAG